MPEPDRSIAKSQFVNIDARVRCPTPDCLGDLVLMPTGRHDAEGFAEFQPFTACPLCLRSYPLDDDLDDRDLALKISWLRANPDAPPASGNEPDTPGPG